MSATDELRRLLDELGVEWQAPASFDGTARYDTIAGGYWFHEFNGKITIHGLTPEQAIAATVGSGRAEDVIRQLIARLGVAADFHFAQKYVDCIVEEYSGKLATPTTLGVSDATQARQDAADLKAENDKLRELLSEIAKLVTNPYGGCLRPGCAHGCPHHLECDEELHTCFYVDRMRELGVEVD